MRYCWGMWTKDRAKGLDKLLTNAQILAMTNAASTRVRQCPECRKWHSRPRSQFCSTDHQSRWNNRQKAEGAAIVAMVKAWAMGRGGGHSGPTDTAKAAMREMTQIARDLNDGDKAANRMNALDYAALLMANGSFHFDRRRARH